MVIKTLDDLADWNAYRKQTSDSIAGLEAGSSVHVSVDDFDFTVRGEPWPGRVVLCGKKGDTSMAALKQKGVQFRTGTGTLAADQQTVMVEGLSGGFLKAANKTLTKLALAYSLEAGTVEAESDDASGKRGGRKDDKDEKNEKSKGGRAAEADSAADAKDAKAQKQLADRVRKSKSELQARIRAALTGDPAGRAAVEKLVREAAAAEKGGDLDAALAALEQLEEELDRLESPSATGAQDDADVDVDEDEEVEDEAEDEDARTEASRRKAPLYQSVREAIAGDPDLRGPVTELVRQADKQEKAGDFAELLTTYDELEDLLTQAEDEDDEAAANRIDVKDWKQYRKYLRPRLRAFSKSADEPASFWVSKKKIDFDFGGKVLVGRLVMAGKRCQPLVKRLKREGTTFFEGFGHLREEDTTLVVRGLRGGAIKGGGKTLKQLRLGYLLEATDDEAADGDPLAAQYQSRRAALDPAIRSALSARQGDTSALRAADASAAELATMGEWQRALNALARIESLLGESARPDEETIDPGLVEYRKSLVQFAQTRSAVRASFAALQQRVAAIPGEEDLAQALAQRLEERFTEIDGVVTDAINTSRDQRAPVTAAVRAAIESALSDVAADPLLAHVETNQWGVRIRAPLQQALSQILRTMPAGEAEPAVG